MSDPGEAQYVVRAEGATLDGCPGWLFVLGSADWETIGSLSGATRFTLRTANRYADMMRDRVPRSCAVSVLMVADDGTETRVPTHEEALSAIRDAVDVVTRWGATDGAHHKQWCLDRVLRALLGPEQYAAWVKEFNKDPDYPPWHEGIAP